MLFRTSENEDFRTILLHAGAGIEGDVEISVEQLERLTFGKDVTTLAGALPRESAEASMPKNQESFLRSCGQSYRKRAERNKSRLNHLYWLSANSGAKLRVAFYIT